MSKSNTYASDGNEGEILAKHFGLNLTLDYLPPQAKQEQIAKIHEEPKQIHGLLIKHRGIGFSQHYDLAQVQGKNFTHDILPCTTGDGSCLFSAFGQALAEIAVRSIKKTRATQRKKYHNILYPKPVPTSGDIVDALLPKMATLFSNPLTTLPSSLSYRTPVFTKPTTSLEVDGDGSSDEEDTEKAQQYDLKKVIAALRQDSQIKTILENKNVSIDPVIEFFKIHVEAIQILYKQDVNKFYYQEYKPKLGKFSISQEETDLEDVKKWIKESIEICFREYLSEYFSNPNNVKEMKRQTQSSLLKFGTRIPKFIEELINQPANLRLFLKKMQLASAKEHLIEFLKSQNLEPIQEELKKIKSEDKIRQRKNTTEAELHKDIVQKSPQKVAKALLGKSMNKIALERTDEILRNTLKHTNRLSEDREMKLFELSFAAQLAKTRVNYRIYFDREFPEHLPELPLGSSNYHHIALALRMLNRFEKNRRRELENLKAIYAGLGKNEDEDEARPIIENNAETGVLDSKFMHQFHFGFGKIYNRSAISTKTLGRNEFVVLGGAYKNIVEHIAKITEDKRISDADIALWVEQAVQGNLSKACPLIDKNGNKIDNLLTKGLQIKELIGHIAFLLFFIEPARNPSALLLSQYACSLIKAGVFSWEEILSHKEKQKTLSGGEKSCLVSGGLHPMTHIEIVPSSRFLLYLFAPYSPYPYYYEGEMKQDKLQMFIKNALILKNWFTFLEAYPVSILPLVTKYGRKQALKLFQNERLKPILSGLAIYSEKLDEEELELLSYAAFRYDFSNAIARFPFEVIWDAVVDEDENKNEEKEFDFDRELIYFLNENQTAFKINFQDIYNTFLTDDEADGYHSSGPESEDEQPKAFPKKFRYETDAVENFLNFISSSSDESDLSYSPPKTSLVFQSSDNDNLPGYETENETSHFF